MADVVILDLARSGDWSVRERLVRMFREADPETNWLRVPVLQYLKLCPLPEAKADLDALEKLDPAALELAQRFSGLWQDKPATARDVAP